MNPSNSRPCNCGFCQTCVVQEALSRFKDVVATPVSLKCKHCGGLNEHHPSVFFYPVFAPQPRVMDVHIVPDPDRASKFSR